MRVFQFLIFITLFCFQSSAQDMQAIYELALKGNHQEALSQYDQVLAKNANHKDALLGRAHVLSWMNYYEKSEADYLNVLELDPKNIRALIGLGYLYGWNDFPYSAIEHFERAIELKPSNQDALKGLAYTYLWNQDYKRAEKYFKILRQNDESNLEAWLGLGETYIESGEHYQGRQVMGKVLSFNPMNEQAKHQLDHVIYKPAMFDFSIWSGMASVESEDTFGIRSLEIGYAPKPDWRTWIRYDNSLSLENFSLIKGNQHLRSYYLGASSVINKTFSTKVEYGIRNLPGDVIQHLVHLEEVIQTSDKSFVKLGGFYAPATNLPNEYMAFGGVKFIPHSQFSIEPILFYSSTTINEISETRLALTNEYRFKNRHQLTASGFVGFVNSDLNFIKENTGGGALGYYLPVANRHWLQFMLRYESGIFDDFLAGNIGFKFRLEK